MQRIFLIGHMGSGKTTFGKGLATKCKIEFIDMDKYIEKKYKKSIIDIFTIDGEETFRKKEQISLHEIIQMHNKVVISTGGGTPCFFNNMKIMNNNGITIFLKTPLNILSHRLNILKLTRPLIKDKSKKEIQNLFVHNLSQRDFFYNQASVIYSVISNTGIDQIVTDLIKKIKIYQNICTK